MSEITKQIDVRGMYCSNCANRIEKVVGKMDGVAGIKVNLATDIGQVTFQQNRTNLENVITKINNIGFEAKLHQRVERKSRREEQVLKENIIFSILLTLPLAWGMLAHIKVLEFIYVPALFDHPLFQFCIAVPIQFIFGFTFYERAWKALRHGSLNMDVLVVLSTSATYFYSYYMRFTVPGLVD